MPSDSFNHVSFGSGITKNGRYAAPTVAPFDWSGNFPILAQNHAELIAMLGIDGSVSVDVSAGSHIWQMGSLAAPDTGSLATSSFDFLAAADVTYPTDSNFGNGSPNVDLTGVTTTAYHRTPDGTTYIPSVMDGTKSFMVGGLCEIHSMRGLETTCQLLSKQALGYGWMLRGRDAVLGGYDVGYLQMVLHENGFSQNTYAGTSAPLDGAPLVGVSFDEPFAFLFGLDVAAGKTFIMISKANSLAETAWSDGGTFATSEGVRVGSSDGPLNQDDSFTGIMAQVFSVEWSGAVDAGITYANMENFLKYSDGYLNL